MVLVSRIPPRKLLAAAILLAAAGFSLARFGGGSARRPSGREARDLPRTARVIRVLDGDSVVLSGGVELRYAGVDAPERGEPFAEEARDWNRAAVAKKRVRLEYDEETSDRYGRLLAYVSVSREGEWRMVNEEIVRAGLARAYPNFPNFRHRDRFTEAQKEARRARRGIWSVERGGYAGPFIGSATRFHRPDCEHVPRIRRPRKIGSRDRALDAGLSPCRTCRP